MRCVCEGEGEGEGERRNEAKVGMLSAAGRRRAWDRGASYSIWKFEHPEAQSFPNRPNLFTFVANYSFNRGSVENCLFTIHEVVVRSVYILPPRQTSLVGFH